MDAPTPAPGPRPLLLVPALGALVLGACFDSPDAPDPASVAPPVTHVTIDPGAPDPAPGQVPPIPSPQADASPASSVDTAASPGSLLVESVRIVEFQYPDLPGHNFYAPLVRVSAVNGPLVVKTMTVGFPNGAHAARICGNLTVNAEPRELVREIYGDYELSVDFTNGQMAGAGDFSVRISFIDGGGREEVVEAAAPATPGSLPGTYTGGRSAWTEACQ